MNTIMMFLTAFFNPVLLTDSAGSGFDITQTVDILFAIIERFLGLFLIWPLNIFMGIGLVFTGIALFSKLKKSAKN